MDPYNLDFDDDWDEGSTDGDMGEDRSVLERASHCLGLARDYVPDWRSGHAIREFYQNWKDSIIQTFELRQTNFELVIHGFNAKDVYVAEAHHPDTQELLGFIRFQDGVLEFTNFKAQLSRKALDIGATTKRENEQTAGTHGEGFKVAALVMTKNEYRVRYEASKYYWAFKFGGRQKKTLYCALRPMAEEKLRNQMKKHTEIVAKGKKRELNSNIWEDVTVKIGKVQGIGRKIDKKNFLKWIDVSLDLNRPSSMIRTRHGSLILDENFGSRIYLKGLLLESNSSEKPFKFGYNLLHGKVNRDRERLFDPAEEAKVLAEIWEEAIQSQERDVMDKYVSMLLDDEAADVHRTGDYISRSTAEKVWQHLLEKDPDRKCFYHDSRNGDRDVEIIRNSLKKEPRQLSRILWVPLHKFELVRTPKEHQFHLLHSAPRAEEKETLYAAGVERALKAALALDARTKGLEVVFKCGIRTDLDLLLSHDDSKLEINDRWLEFRQSHSKTPCWLSRQSHREYSSLDHFSCDHIVTDLYELVLQELRRRPYMTWAQRQESDSSLYQRVCESLRQMPLMVEAKQGTLPGIIEVSWLDLEGDMISKIYGLDAKCRVTLHRESTCSAKRCDLLTPIQPEDPGLADAETIVAGCGCPEKTVPQKQFRAIFEGLNHEEEYFAMVSREDSQAFFGLPPRSLRPNAPSRHQQRRPSPTRNFMSGALGHPEQGGDAKHEDGNWDQGNIYDASSDEENANQANSPISRSSSQSSVSGPEALMRQGLATTASRELTPTQSRMTSELQKLRSESKSQQRQLAAKDQILDKLHAEIDSKTKKLASNEKAIQKLKEEVENAKTQLQAQDEKIRNFTTRIHAQQKHFQTKDQLIRETQAEKRAVELRISPLLNQLAQLKTENGVHREQTRAKLDELDQAREELKKERESLTVAAEPNQARDERQRVLEAQLVTVQKNLKAANSIIDDLNIRDQDATGSIEALRIQIQELQQRIEDLEDENGDLENKLKEAEEAYDLQLKLAADAVVRRKTTLGKVKRERDCETPEFSARGPKRPRTVITIGEDGTVDLTSEENGGISGPSASGS